VSVVREIAVVLLLGVSAIVTALSAVGVLAMRDPWQRLHFIAPPALSVFPVVAALALDGAGLAASLEALLVAVLLVSNGAVLSHAIARAVFAHTRGRWPPAPGDVAAVNDEEDAS
jgi:multisubunit Na+/H+ antiporter MnhG subunit